MLVNKPKVNTFSSYLEVVRDEMVISENKTQN